MNILSNQNSKKEIMQLLLYRSSYEFVEEINKLKNQRSNLNFNNLLYEFSLSFLSFYIPS